MSDIHQLEFETHLRDAIAAGDRLRRHDVDLVFGQRHSDIHQQSRTVERCDFDGSDERGLGLFLTVPFDVDQPGRLLGHEDVDLFTILPAAKVSGLQVWNHHSQKWVRLDAPAGSIIINTGDYMQRITNDLLPSTSHRVGKPVDGSQNDTARISFPMAVYVWEEEILEGLPGLGQPKYQPIKAITFHTRSTSKFYGDDYAVG